jgi:protein-S-isoprenylcysteine O-methyltransferase Ste14
LAPTGKKQDVGTTPKYIDRKPCLRYQCSPWWLLITALGIAFAIWARAHLGANWSAAVSIRADHELIRTGPYRRTRHPIYTGMILELPFFFFGLAVSRFVGIDHFLR